MAASNGHQTAPEQDESMRIVNQVQLKGKDFDATMKFYDDWTPTYDKTCNSIAYTGPKLVAAYLKKHARNTNITTDSLILDVGAGTGFAAEELSALGYHNIDGVDASEPMLRAASEKGVYQRLFCAKIGEGRRLPMLDDSYDGAVMSGIFAEGHVKLDALLEVIRLVKPGGLIVNVMRENNIRDVDEYRNINELFSDWEQKRLWECVEQVIPKEKYYQDYDALVHVYKVCALN